MKDRELVFEQIMAKDFLKLIKDINRQIQESIAYTKQDIYK